MLLRETSSANAPVGLFPVRGQSAQATIAFEDVSVCGRLINTEAHRGEILRLTGGSLILRMLILALFGGALAPQSGIIRCWDGSPFESLHQASQRAAVLQWDVLPEGESVLSVLRGAVSTRGVTDACGQSATLRLLDRLGAEFLAACRVADLSTSGQRLVLLARALLGQPAVLALEHPEAHLCSDVVGSLASELKAFVAITGAVVVLATAHDELSRVTSRTLDLDAFA